MPSAADLWAGAIISCAFLTLIGLAELWRRTLRPPVEHTRKLVHAAGGLVCLTLPFFIQSHWVVLAMAIGMAALFAVTKFFGLLPAIHSVSRRSRGTEYYPLVIYLLFVLAHGTPWKYVICVLTLCVSDTLAALIGGRYGRLRYEVEEDRRSVEGSLVFFTATFVVVLLPLLLWNDPTIPPPLNCVLAALLIAALVTGFEAISLGGADNLWVPLGTYVVLTKILRQPLNEIIVQNVSLATLGIAIAMSAWWSRAFNVGGALVVLLATYACWSLGSLDWALPVAIGFLVYIAGRKSWQRDTRLRVRRVAWALLPPFLVLSAANAAWIAGRMDLYVFCYGPFLAGVTVVVVHALLMPTDGARSHQVRPLAALLTGSAAVLFMTLPVWWLQSTLPTLAVAAVVLATVAIALLAELADKRFRIAHRRVMQCGWTIAAMVLIAALQYRDLLPVWHPA